MDWLAEAQALAAKETPQEALPLVPHTVPGRILMVDGDMIAYGCAGNDETSPGDARLRAIHRITNLRDLSGSEKVVVHLTDDSSTKGDRNIIATVKPYQGNRSKSSRKPKNWGYLRDWMQSYAGDLYTVKTWGTREADDGIAYHATVVGVDKTVIASNDKDLRMIPGWHIDWVSYEMTRLGSDQFSVVGENTKQYGHKWFWLQCLMGDGVDNIPGLPKYIDLKGKAKLVGEVTAKKFLECSTNDTDASRGVAAMYKSFYGDEWPDRLAEQMALLWMRRDKEAAVNDFVGWFFYEPNDPFHRVMFDAGQRLVDRVQKAKEDLPWSA